LPPNIGALTGAIEFATQLAEQRTTPPASSDVTPHTTTGVESTFPSALPADAPTTDRALPEQDTATPRREPPIEEVMEALGESEPQTDPHSGPHPDRPPGPLRRARQEPPNRTDSDEVRRPIDHNPETPGLDDGTGRGLGLPDQ
jgi:hypothetical protein